MTDMKPYIQRKARYELKKLLVKDELKMVVDELRK